MAGKDPIMYAYAAELDIRVARARLHFTTEHIRGPCNIEADALSRLLAGASLPRALKGVP
eukprot:695655-Amphidinium_carterae.1